MHARRVENLSVFVAATAFCPQASGRREAVQQSPKSLASKKQMRAPDSSIAQQNLAFLFFVVAAAFRSQASGGDRAIES